MTTATAPATFRGSQSDARITFGTLIRSQWITLRSLRGTTVSLIIGAALTIAFAAGFAMLLALSNQLSADEMPMPDVTLLGLNTVVVAVAVAVLVAVAHYAKERSTGALRTTLAAAPRRVGILGAKAVVITVSTYVAAAITLALSIAAVSLVYLAFGYEVAVGSFVGDLLLPVLGGALYVTAAAVFALGIAVLLRSETWSVMVVLMVILVLPIVFQMLPFDWAPTVGELLLSNAGQSLLFPFEGFSGELLRNLGVTVAWPVVALVAGMAVERTRDA